MPRCTPPGFDIPTQPSTATRRVARPNVWSRECPYFRPGRATLADEYERGGSPPALLLRRFGMTVRKLVAECLGTALLVFFAVGVANLPVGKVAIGPPCECLVGTSVAAGIVATALAFGLVMLIL